MEAVAAELISPLAQTMAQDAEATLERMRRVKILTPEGYQDAAAKLTSVKGKAKDLEELRKTMTRPLDESKAKIMDFFRKPADFLTQAEKIIKDAMLSFQREQERLRQEAEAERRRIENEARQRQLEEARAAEARAAAESLKQQGNAPAAEEQRQVAIAAEGRAMQMPLMELPPPPPAPVKAAGVAIRKNWKVRVVNPELVPRNLCIPDLAALAKIASEHKDMAQVPGCEFYAEEVLASR